MTDGDNDPGAPVPSAVLNAARARSVSSEPSAGIASLPGPPPLFLTGTQVAHEMQLLVQIVL